MENFGDKIDDSQSPNKSETFDGENIENNKTNPIRLTSAAVTQTNMNLLNQPHINNQDRISSAVINQYTNTNRNQLKSPFSPKPTYLMQKTNEDNIKFVFPVVFLSNSKTHLRNNSEKKRFSSISELFLKLKYLIDKDIGNKYTYINEVINEIITSYFNLVFYKS